MSKNNLLARAKSLLSWSGSAIRSSLRFFNTTIEEPFTGAWQRNIGARAESSIENFAAFACVTQTANDVSKLEIEIKKRMQHGVWKVDYSRKYRYLRDLFDHPNPNQNIQDFLFRWVTSLQTFGNAFVFVDWDGEIPVGMYLLDPCRVAVERSNDGEIFYRVSADRVIGLYQDFVFTSEQIIHHRINPIFDDMIGIPPLLAAMIHIMSSNEQGKTAFEFYKNAARPSGILIAPNDINEEEVKQLKEDMTNATTGRQNAGRLFVISGGVQYQQLSQSAHDQQLIEQMKFNAEAICACFHVPTYMILGNAPSYNNIEALSQEYFQKALQFIIVGIEKNLYRGLRLNQTADDIYPEFNLHNLLRMDKTSRYKSYGEGIKAGWMTPNEARAQEDLEPLEGGDTAYMQQQNYSLAALAARDATNPLVVKPTDPPAAPETPEEETPDEENAEGEDTEKEKLENEEQEDENLKKFLKLLDDNL